MVPVQNVISITSETQSNKVSFVYNLFCSFTNLLGILCRYRRVLYWTIGQPKMVLYTYGFEMCFGRISHVTQGPEMFVKSKRPQTIINPKSNQQPHDWMPDIMMNLGGYGERHWMVKAMTQLTQSSPFLAASLWCLIQTVSASGIRAVPSDFNHTKVQIDGKIWGWDCEVPYATHTLFTDSVMTICYILSVFAIHVRFTFRKLCAIGDNEEVIWSQVKAVMLFLADMIHNRLC